MRSKFAIVAAALLLSFMAIPASHATVVTFGFSGVVTDKGRGVIADGTTIGDPVRGFASYDTLDFEMTNPPLSEFRGWNDNSTMSLTINGMTWSFSGGFAQVRNRIAPDSRPDFLSIGLQGITGPEAQPGSGMGIFFLAPSTFFSNAILPSGSDLLRLFDASESTGNLSIIANDRVGFRVTSITLLPEPGTLALYGLGLAGLGFAARRGRARLVSTP